MSAHPQWHWKEGGPWLGKDVSLQVLVLSGIPGISGPLPSAMFVLDLWPLKFRLSSLFAKEVGTSRSLRQKDHKFKSCLVNLVRHCLKI